MPERANDIFDIEKRLLRHLFGKRREELAHITRRSARAGPQPHAERDVESQSEVREGLRHRDRRPGSHTAIVAEALGIPAVVGIGPFLTDVSGGETAIIDGYQGLVILHPDEETLARYRHEVVQYRSHAAKLEKLRDLPAETADGVRIQLLGNIEFPYEVEQCQKRGADGIGLYRTEFLFLAARRRADRGRADAPPTREVAEAMRGQAGRDADDRPGRRQAAERARFPRTSAIRSSACAAFGWR